MQISAIKAESTTTLVVDDEETNSRVLEAFFRNRFTLFHAFDCQEAEPYLRQSGIKLILLDYQFPHSQKNGVELADEYQQTHPHIPVMILTGYQGEELSRQCRERRLPIITKTEGWVEAFGESAEFILSRPEQGRLNPEDYPQVVQIIARCIKRQTWSPQQDKLNIEQMYLDHHDAAKEKVNKLMKELSLTPDKELAQDIVHDAYHTIQQINPEFRNGWEFRAYLIKTIKTTFLNWLRGKQRKQKWMLSWDDLPYPVENIPETKHPSPQENFLEEQRNTDSLYEAVEQLPEKLKAVMLLYMDDLSNSQIAEKLKLKENTVRQRVCRAINALKKK